ncbi:hypothetical protein [Nocardioides pakistanensis]
MTRKIVGLDLSLTSTGVAVIVGQHAHVDRIQTKPAGNAIADRSKRLRAIVGNIAAWCSDAPLVVVEGPSLGQGRQVGTHDRAGLWWLTVARLTGMGLHVVEVPPAVVKKYATGKGGGKDAGKDQVLASVIRRYPHVEVTGNDEADALVLAAMGARWAGHPIDDPLPALQLAAMAKPQWPDHDEVKF